MYPRGFKLPASVGEAAKRLSKLLGTMPQSPSLFITAIPIDIVERILLHLSGQDILVMKRVRWGS